MWSKKSQQETQQETQQPTQQGRRKAWQLRGAGPGSRTRCATTEDGRGHSVRHHVSSPLGACDSALHSAIAALSSQHSIAPATAAHSAVVAGEPGRALTPAQSKQTRARSALPSWVEKSLLTILNVWHIAQDFGISPRILTYQVRLAYQPGF